MFPEELKKLNQWVCVKNDSKIPFRAFENRSASSIDPKSWSSYDMAKRAVDKGLYDGLGFVFADNGYVAIDIDDGYNLDGTMTDLAMDIIGMLGSYTEKSRSGRGFHIIAKGDLPFKGRNNLKGVEIYKTSRYFIMTGDVFHFDEIIENQEGISHVLETYFKHIPTLEYERNPTIYNLKWDIPKGERIRLKPEYPPLEKGGRNLGLTSLAGQLYSVGYNKSQIMKELMTCNLEACLPRLNESEIEQIVRSVTRYRRT